MMNVTCAVIRNDSNDVLIVQKAESTDHPLKWEFPGGKIKRGESEEDCIIREISEELSINIIICSRLEIVEYDYGHKQIRLIPFICDTLDEFPVLSEHVAYKWVSAKDLQSVDFSEADVFVAKNYLDCMKPDDFPCLKASPEISKPSIDDTDLKKMVNSMMSMKEAEWVAVSAAENPAVFNKLLEYSLTPDNKLSFRASWTLTKVCDRYPELIYPYLSEIVEVLNKLDNVSTLRSFLRIISLSDLGKINNQQHGILADFCFTTLNSGFSAIAVKAYSMEILYKLSLIYPELRNELAASVILLLEDGTAGVTSRGRMILKKLDRISTGLRSSQI